MNESQKTICKIILKILKIDAFKQNISKKSNKHILVEIVRQYAETNNNYLKAYDDIKLCKDHFQFTVRAVAVLNITPNNNKIWKTSLHREHIVPISIIIGDLLKLNKGNLTYYHICKIMKDNEVVILTHEESKALDGSPSITYFINSIPYLGQGMKYKGTKKQRLDAIDAVLDLGYINNAINK